MTDFDPVLVAKWTERLKSVGKALAEKLDAADDGEAVGLVRAASDSDLDLAHTWAFLDGDCCTVALVSFEEGRRVGVKEGRAS